MLLESTLVSITKYCQYQERCHSEAMGKLLELGCTISEAEEYIAELITAGILNEERFARAYARGKFRMLGWGRVKIAQQLRFKKVSDYCIKKGLSEINGEEYAEKLKKLVEKKQNELKKERSKRIKHQKIYKYIIQKGYESDIVTDLLKDINNEGNM